DLVRGGTVGIFHVVVVLGREGNRTPVEHGRFGKASAQRNGPFVSARGIPVGGDDRRGAKRPSLRKVVIDERLKQEAVDLGRSTFVGKGEQVVDQRTVEPRTVAQEHYPSWAEGPAARPCRISSCRGQ